MEYYNNRKPGLIVFVKNPIVGEVKTRLAKSVGDEKALKIYHFLLNHTHKVCNNLNLDKYLFYHKFIDSDDQWDSKDYKKYLQYGKDLGQTMANAFQDVFEMSQPLIIVGSDCPEINTEIINAAIKNLQTFDVVLGPSNDGGYYLLGLNSFHPEIFKDIAWSTSEVLSKTIEKISKLNLSYYLMEQLVDIDTLEDWNDYLNNSQQKNII